MNQQTKNYLVAYVTGVVKGMDIVGFTLSKGLDFIVGKNLGIGGLGGSIGEAADTLFLIYPNADKLERYLGEVKEYYTSQDIHAALLKEKSQFKKKHREFSERYDQLLSEIEQEALAEPPKLNINKKSTYEKIINKLGNATGVAGLALVYFTFPLGLVPTLYVSAGIPLMARIDDTFNQKAKESCIRNLSILWQKEDC